MTVQIADSRVELETGEVWREGHERQLTPKSAAVLRYLCERPQELVTSEELLDEFWTGSFSADNAVQKAISEIRAAFGDDAKNPRIVRTVSKRGYILLETPLRPDPADESTQVDQPGAVSTEDVAAGAGRRLALRVAAAALGFALLVEIFVWVSEDLPFAQEAPPAAGPPLTSIAVLPFDDLSPEGDQRWLTHGLSEQLIESLSRIEALQVMARTSSQAVKNEGVDAIVAGERLGVGTLVEGSVRTSGDQVRITAQLIRTADANHLWSATYDRLLDDVLELQSEIGREVAEAIREELGATDGPSWLQRSRYLTADVRAFELVRKGVELEGLRTEEGFRGEIALTEQALAIDPRYAQAHAQQGFAYWFLYQWGFERTQAVRARAEEKARDALELEPENASANNLLVELAMQAGRWSEAEDRVRAAIAANPRVGPLRSSYAAILVNTGRVKEGLTQAQRAKDLDPLSPGFWSTLGRVQLVHGDADEAIVEFQRARAAGRSEAPPHLLVAYHLAGRDEEGLALLRELGAEEAPLQEAYQQGGFAAALSLWLDKVAPRSCSWTTLLALGESESEFRRCAEDLSDQKLAAWWFLGQQPVFAPYRDKAWFRALLETNGLLDARQD